MAKVFLSLGLMAMVGLASPAFGQYLAGRPHPAPAPEIGASMIGVALAVGLAAYVRRRCKR